MEYVSARYPADRDRSHFPGCQFLVGILYSSLRIARAEKMRLFWIFRFPRLGRANRLAKSCWLAAHSHGDSLAVERQEERF